MRAPANPWPPVVAGGIFAAFLLGLVALGQAKLAGSILLALFFVLVVVFL